MLDTTNATRVSGTLACDNDRPHGRHEWDYTDAATKLTDHVLCLGLTWADIREQQREGARCCGDPLCPCDTKPGHAGTTPAAMRRSELTSNTNPEGDRDNDD